MADNVPRDGDLVISRRKDNGRFEITVSPGRPQMSLQFKNEAINHAYAYADQHGAAVWYAEVTGEFTRLERVRRKES